MRLIITAAFGVATLGCAGLLAQSGPSAKPQFEVATIRQAPPISVTSGQPVTGGFRMDGQQMRATLMPLRDYLGVAYKLPIYRIEAPDWMISTRFDISATLPEGSKQDQVSDMMAALLTERFHIKSHRESKEFPVYALVVLKGGILAKEDPLDPEERTVDATGTGSAAGTFIKLPRGASLAIQGNKIEVKKFGMAALADTLGRFMDRPVVDQTGLGDTAYDISLELAPEDFMAMMVRSGVAAGITMAIKSSGASSSEIS